MITVLIVEDHPAVAEGLRHVLRDATFDVVGIARDIDEALDLAARHRPQVVLSDVMFGSKPLGLDLGRDLVRIGAENPALLYLSSFDDDWLYEAALKRGAAGYVLKSAEPSEIAAAIRLVAAGGTSFPAQAVRRAAALPRPPTQRERQIIELVSRAAGNGEIAQRLGLSEKTIEVTSLACMRGTRRLVGWNWSCMRSAAAGSRNLRHGTRTRIHR